MVKLSPVLFATDQAVFERGTLGAALCGWALVLLGATTPCLGALESDPAHGPRFAAGAFTAAASNVGVDDSRASALFAAMDSLGGANEVGLDQLRQGSNFPAWAMAFESAMMLVAMLRQL